MSAEKVKTMQNNWIGESTGLQFKFEIAIAPDDDYEPIEFLLRDLIHFWASFVAVAADHPIVKKLEKNNPEINSFIKVQIKRNNLSRNRKS